MRVLTNRDFSRSARRTRFWCAGCDRNLVSDVGKCGVCGKKHNKKRSIDKGIHEGNANA
jgi:hypothetical protein